MSETPAMDGLAPSDREHADALLARARCGDARVEGAALAALAAWARGHAQREDYIRRVDAVSSLMDRAAPELQERYPRRSAHRASGGRRYASFALHGAAAGLVLLAVAAAVWWANPLLEGQVLETAAGNQRTVVLADGSRITLNSRSRVEVQLRLRSRDAILEEGEALFEVGKSAYRPWTTLAADARIAVLGTIFNVRRDGDAVRLTVFEGRVAFDPGSGLDVVLVDAGKSAESRAGSLVARPATANLALVGAWREQRMVFDDTPLVEAMNEAGRYRKAAIRVDPRVAGLRITGAFPTTDPERLLRLLPEAMPVAVIRAPDGSVDLKPREPEPAGAWQPPAIANQRP